MPAQLRPLNDSDADAVLDLQFETFDDLRRRLSLPYGAPPADRAPGLNRIHHLVQTDPGGAWIATDPDGTVVGAALALVREGMWGLSLLVVRPGRQSEGIGSELLRRAVDYDNGARGGLILATEDPRALRAYARAGHALRPVMDAEGPVRHRPPHPGGVRELRWPEDREIVDAASRYVRGATHAGEVPVFLRAGSEVLVHEDAGWVAFKDGAVKVLAATDEAVAADLLRAVLNRAPEGASCAVDFLDAANDWAFRVVLDAGLRLRPSGALCVRGDVGPLAPYLPSGSYL